jgi:hypothetical protein
MGDEDFYVEKYLQQREEKITDGSQQNLTIPGLFHNGVSFSMK